MWLAQGHPENWHWNCESFLSCAQSFKRGIPLRGVPSMLKMTPTHFTDAHNKYTNMLTFNSEDNSPFCSFFIFCLFHYPMFHLLISLWFFCLSTPVLSLLFIFGFIPLFHYWCSPFMKMVTQRPWAVGASPRLDHFESICFISFFSTLSSCSGNSSMNTSLNLHQRVAVRA